MKCESRPVQAALTTSVSPGSVAKKTDADAFRARAEARLSHEDPGNPDAIHAATHAALREANATAAEAPCTDAGNAERLVARHGADLLHIHPWSSWLVWDGVRFRRDDKGAVMAKAKETIRSLLDVAQGLPDPKRRELIQHAVKSEAEPRLRAMIALARSEAGIPRLPEELDGDPYRLGVANGVIDLRRGDLRQASRLDLITRACSVAFDPDATCPRWLRFLDEVFAGDQELIAFVKRLIGYTLTGDTSEHKLIMLHGAGRNGKSTLIETVKAILGDLAATAAFDSFTRKPGSNGPRNDLARLAGARLVAASESGKGRRLDEATIKQVTGGDTITARFLHAEHFEFRPQFKLFLVTNHRPRVDGGDAALWARLREVPFGVSFEGREDPELESELRDELPGILRWAVEGCVEWQESGLGTAAVIREATDAYRAEEDTIGSFLAETCREGSELEVEVAALQREYEQYCSDAGEEPESASALGRELGRRGITRGGKGRRLYKGVALR